MVRKKERRDECCLILPLVVLLVVNTLRFKQSVLFGGRTAIRCIRDAEQRLCSVVVTREERISVLGWYSQKGGVEIALDRRQALPFFHAGAAGSSLGCAFGRSPQKIILRQHSRQVMQCGAAWHRRLKHSFNNVIYLLHAASLTRGVA